jgi:hypothetical protein
VRSKPLNQVTQNPWQVHTDLQISCKLRLLQEAPSSRATDDSLAFIEARVGLEKLKESSSIQIQELRDQLLTVQHLVTG